MYKLHRMYINDLAVDGTLNTTNQPTYSIYVCGFLYPSICVHPSDFLSHFVSVCMSMMSVCV